ncbi:MAG TPA: hypothetical protein DC031_01565 [Sulfitobacter sp.]|uniref:hypothetical protein n=1 Tax=Sulfitobacter dubius TaxID=218673 RepID=UPI000E80AAEB|nr:hypothetical protein [Sulfitobacter sp.]
MNWQPHFCYEEITRHKDGTETAYRRHWVFGVLVSDTFPRARVLAGKVPTLEELRAEKSK